MLWLALAVSSAFFVALKNVYTRTVVTRVRQRSVVYSGFLVTGILSLVYVTVEGTPAVEPGFYGAVLAASLVDVFAVTMLIRAISSADLADAYPLVALTPVFLLGTSFLFLGEVPSISGIAGVVTIVVGSYLMRIEGANKDPLEPFRRLFREKGPRYMMGAAVLFSVMGPLFKTAVIHSSPALALTASQFLSVAWLTIWYPVRGELKPVWRELRTYSVPLLVLGLLTFLQAIALFMAFELTLVAYAVSVKRLGILFTVLLGYVAYREKGALRGAASGGVMVAGVFLISLG